MNFSTFKTSLNQFVQQAATTAKDLSKDITTQARPARFCPLVRAGGDIRATLLPSTAGGVAPNQRVGYQVAGARLLREYAVQSQAATGGLECCWKIFSAKQRRAGEFAGAAVDPTTWKCHALAFCCTQSYYRETTSGQALAFSERGHECRPFNVAFAIDTEDAKGPGASLVSVWILEKRTFTEGLSPPQVETHLTALRRDIQMLTKLKHPSLLQVAQESGGIRC